MKVDMSPRAVTDRLRTLDELWLLSVKLMKSKKIRKAKDSTSELSSHPGNKIPSFEKR